MNNIKVLRMLQTKAALEYNPDAQIVLFLLNGEEEFTRGLKSPQKVNAIMFALNSIACRILAIASMSKAYEDAPEGSYKTSMGMQLSNLEDHMAEDYGIIFINIAPNNKIGRMRALQSIEEIHKLKAPCVSNMIRQWKVEGV